MKNPSKVLVVILTLGLLLRLSISTFQYSGDIKNHFVWAQGFLSEPVGFYSQKFSGFNDPNYPPLAIFAFSLSLSLYFGVSHLFHFLNSTLSFFPSLLVPFIQSENTAYAFLKLPGILSDIGIGILLYKLLKKDSEKKALVFTSFFIFNPATIYLSAVWGQTEPVTVFFLLLSFYFRQSFLSFAFFCLALLTKQTALWVLPFYALFWARHFPRPIFLKGVFLALFIFFLSYLPFGLGPLRATRNYFATLSGSSTLVSDAAWNFWYFLTAPGTEDSALFLGVSIRGLSLVLLLLTLGYYSYRYWFKASEKYLSNYLYLWSVVVFFLQTRVHERHLYPALVFLLLTNQKQKTITLAFIIFTIYHYLNLRWSLRLPFI